MMRKSVIVVVLAAAMMGSGAFLAGAQENGLVIQNNGVDSSNSAAGADNVNISRAAGNSSSTNGPGANNEAGRVVSEKNRDRKDRGARNGGGEAAPAEAAPAEGDYQEYADPGEWVEPMAVPQEIVAESAADALDPNLPIQLPNTGIGEPAFAFSALAAGLAAAFAMASRGQRKHV